MAVSQETKDMAWSLFKMGMVGTAVGIPVGIWSLQRWPNETWKTAVLLTAISFGIKEVMLHGPEVQSEEARVIASRTA